MRNFVRLVLTLSCLLITTISVFGQEENEVIKQISKRPIKTIAYELVHIAPQHPNCDDTKDDPQGRRCLTQTLVKKISEDFNKSLLFATQNGQRRIIITMLIDEKGIIGFTNTNSEDQIFDKEIKRIIATLPALSPGQHMRKPVRVRLRLPMTFLVSD